MSAAETLTFDITPIPRRPTLEDCGGATLIDDPGEPPDKTFMPYAAQLNQLQKLAAAFGRVAPVAIVWVRMVSGTPTIYAAQACGTAISPSSFTAADEGVGITRIDWAANLFPAPVGEADVSISYTSDANNPAIAAAMAGAQMTTNGCRVRTYDAAGAAVDANFRFALY